MPIVQAQGIVTMQLTSVAGGSITLNGTNVWYETSTRVVTGFIVQFDSNGDGIDDAVIIFHLAEVEREKNLVERALDAAGLLDVARTGARAVTDIAREVAKLWRTSKKIRLAAVAVTALGGVASVATALILNKIEEEVAKRFFDMLDSPRPKVYRSQSGEDVFKGPITLK
jgi:hypothetical protein